MSDLVERLQRKIGFLFENKCRLVEELEQEINGRMKLVARITELEAENARLREALKPFASAADPHKHMHDEGCALIQVYHLRRARAALSGQGDGE